MAPVTLAGAVTQFVAEGLSAIVLLQCIKPGVPCAIGSFTSNVDMRTGAPAFGTADFLTFYGLYSVRNRRYPMKLSEQIKPISYLKVHAAKIARTLGEQQQPLIITQNGEAKMVVQDIDSYERMQETVSLLKIRRVGQPPDRSGASEACR